ncbi:hypothetical protein ACA910_010721 [Epithemia clementina (nom. ined.)]
MIQHNRYNKYFSSTLSSKDAHDNSIVARSLASAAVRGSNEENGTVEHYESQQDQNEKEQGTFRSRLMRRRHLGTTVSDRLRVGTTQQTAATSNSTADCSSEASAAMKDRHFPSLSSGQQSKGAPEHYLSRPSLELHQRDEDGETDAADDSFYETKPQHHTSTARSTTQYTPSSRKPQYYRVSYRGVVALLAEPKSSAVRSGTYLGYGEIFASNFEVPVVAALCDDDESLGMDYFYNSGESRVRRPPATAEQQYPLDHDSLSKGIIDSPPRSVASQYTSGSISSLDTFQSRSTVSAHTTSTATGEGAKQVHPHASVNGRGSPPPLFRTLDDNNGARQDSCRLTDGSETHSLLQNKAIRVDRVLTGGYAVDGLGGLQTTISSHHAEDGSGVESPKQCVMGYQLPMIDSPPEQSMAGEEGAADGNQNGLGFLFLRRREEQIVERINYTPHVEEGRFQYRVISSTPLPIFAGPSLDAPRIKAMALPGTIHDVSLRLRCDDSTTTINAANKFSKLNNQISKDHVWFLRLSHRRGWVLDKKKVRKDHSTEKWLTVMREILNSDNDMISIADDVSAVSSVASSSALTPTAAGARRRHLPPRKRRDAASAASSKDHHSEKPAGRTNVSKPPAVAGFSTPVKPKHADNHSSMMTPSSTVSILSDDSSVDRSGTAGRNGSVPTSPDFSQTSTIASTATSNVETTSQNTQQFYLMRVTAPAGLKILDTPQFQVNNLIRGKSAVASSSQMGSQLDSSSAGTLSSKSRHSIFQTMSSRLGASTGVTTKTGNLTISGMSSSARVFPCGTLFEAAKPMENTGLYSQGAGLIKLSDGSGWAVVPREDELAQQYRSSRPGNRDETIEGESLTAFEELGHAVIESLPVLSYSAADRLVSRTKWVRVVARAGIVVSCPPPLPPLDELSPSSQGSSGIAGALTFGNDSDVASSVASTFVDAMLFRTPKKKGGQENNATPTTTAQSQRQMISSTIPCGMCVEVEKFAVDNRPSQYVRLVGGQGWVPLDVSGKDGCAETSTPEFRFGSFWFRVQAVRGIKVRLGPSRKAPSIRSEDGIHFRFECGEFLRASEVMTVYASQGRKGKPLECFAKLYRNRHARLHQGHEEYRTLQSLSAQSEWVQVCSDEESYLEQCSAEPRIERHKQGWQYSVVSEEGVAIRKGPSFSAETTGIKLSKGDHVVITERVSPAGESITWLRMKEGEGWLHDVDDQKNQLMVSQLQRHRIQTENSTNRSQNHRPKEEAAYSVLMSRLFPSDATKADSSQQHLAARGPR